MVGKGEPVCIRPIVRDVFALILDVSFEVLTSLEAIEAVHLSAIDRGDSRYERVSDVGDRIFGSSQWNHAAIARSSGSCAFAARVSTEEVVVTAVFLDDEYEVFDLSSGQLDLILRLELSDQLEGYLLADEERQIFDPPGPFVERGGRGGGFGGTSTRGFVCGRTRSDHDEGGEDEQRGC